MNIQWFPGHMAKTRRILAENLKYVDVVIELLDARIPISSRNPEFDNLLKTKPRLITLNKCDLADNDISKEWEAWYKSKGLVSVFIDSIKGTGIPKLFSELKELAKDKIEADMARGRKFRPVKTMVVGIPNVGKSSFINRIAGRARAQTGDKPGVTRAKQWVRVNNEIELLDTPGILWPKFEDLTTGLHLSFTGAIKDDVVDIVEVASHLLMKLMQLYPQMVIQRYKIQSIEYENGYDILENVGMKRGCLVSGGEVDLTRTAGIVLDEFRGAKIGRISLERPSDVTDTVEKEEG
ncbi:MAG TPA: ribosome biogenesis GTPase YlqF [Clostridiaceae bacterium]|nr:ribosome biogenesis GTPase YlqF [Clostridiaceae bacterium]